MTAAVGDSGYGAYIRRPVGDGRLIAFTSEERCDAYNEGADQCPPGRKHGEIVGATVWQVGDRPCRGTVATRPRGCSKVAKADSELTVLAVDAGRIAIRTENGISLLARTGRVLREFDVAARAAALSGERLAMRTASAIELYDTASGRLVDHLAAPVGLRLEDLDGDILVTASAGTVTLRRFADGRTSTIRAGGIARAQLERPGLFIASGRRVTFTPMRDILRRLRG